MMISPEERNKHPLETIMKGGAPEKVASEKEANLLMRRGQEQNDTGETVENSSSSSGSDDEESSDIAAARGPESPLSKKNEDHHESKGEGAAAGASSGQEEIANPRSADILLGRGKPFQSHEGNQFMLELVDKYRDKYFKTDRKGKHYIIEEVLGQVKERGGRFILRGMDSEKHHWVQVARSISYRKVGHAFRSKARRSFQQGISPGKRSKAAMEMASAHGMSIAGDLSHSLSNKKRPYASPPPQQTSSLAAAANKTSTGNRTNKKTKKKRDREDSSEAPEFSSASAPGTTTSAGRAGRRVLPAFLSSSAGGSSFVGAPEAGRRKEDFTQKLGRNLKGDFTGVKPRSSPWVATSSSTSRAGADAIMGGRPQIAATNPLLGLPRQLPPVASPGAASAANGGFLSSVAPRRQQGYQHRSSAAGSAPASESTTIAMLRRRQQDVMLNEMMAFEHRLGSQHGQLQLQQQHYDEATAQAMLRQQIFLRQQQWEGGAIDLSAPGHQWHQQQQLAAGQRGLFQRHHFSAGHANNVPPSTASVLMGARRENGGGGSGGNHNPYLFPPASPAQLGLAERESFPLSATLGVGWDGDRATELFLLEQRAIRLQEAAAADEQLRQYHRHQQQRRDYGRHHPGDSRREE